MHQGKPRRCHILRLSLAHSTANNNNKNFSQQSLLMKTMILCISFFRYTYSTTSRIPSKLDEVKKIVIVKFNQTILKAIKYVAAPTESRFWRELKTTADKTPGVKKIHVCLFLYFIRIDSFYSMHQHIIVNLQLEIRDRTGRVVFRWERYLWFRGIFLPFEFLSESNEHHYQHFC